MWTLTMLLNLAIFVHSTESNQRNNDTLEGSTDTKTTEIQALVDYDSGLIFYKDYSIQACFVERIYTSFDDIQVFKLPIPSDNTTSHNDEETQSSVEYYFMSKLGLKFCEGFQLYDASVIFTHITDAESLQVRRRRKRQTHGYYGNVPLGEARAQSNHNQPGQASQAQVQGQVFGSGFFSGQAQSQNGGLSQSQVQLSGVNIRGQIASSSGNAQAQLALGNGAGSGQASGLGQGPSNSQVQVTLGQQDQETMASASATSGGATAGIGGGPGGIGGAGAGSGIYSGGVSPSYGYPQMTAPGSLTMGRPGISDGFYPGTRLFGESVSPGTAAMNGGPSSYGGVGGGLGYVPHQTNIGHGPGTIQSHVVGNGASGLHGIRQNGGLTQQTPGQAPMTMNGYSPTGGVPGSGIRTNGFTDMGGVAGMGLRSPALSGSGQEYGNGRVLYGTSPMGQIGLPSTGGVPGQLGSSVLPSQIGTSSFPGAGPSQIGASSFPGAGTSQTGIGSIPGTGLSPTDTRRISGPGLLPGVGGGIPISSRSSGIPIGHQPGVSYPTGHLTGARPFAQSSTPGAFASTTGIGQAQAQTVYFGYSGNGQVVPLRYEQSSQPGRGESTINGVRRFQDQQVGYGTAGQRQEYGTPGLQDSSSARLGNGYKVNGLKNGHTSYPALVSGLTGSPQQIPGTNGVGRATTLVHQTPSHVPQTQVDSLTTAQRLPSPAQQYGTGLVHTGVGYPTSQTGQQGTDTILSSSGPSLQPGTLTPGYTNGLGARQTPTGYIPSSHSTSQDGLRQTPTLETNGRVNGQRIYSPTGQITHTQPHIPDSTSSAARSNGQPYRINGYGQIIPAGQSGQTMYPTTTTITGESALGQGTIHDGFSPSYGVSRPSPDDPEGKKCTIITFSCTIVIESNGRAKICRPNAVKVNGNGGAQSGTGSNICCC